MSQSLRMPLSTLLVVFMLGLLAPLPHHQPLAQSVAGENRRGEAFHFNGHHMVRSARVHRKRCAVWDQGR